ncbi:MAG: putative toxin-antitoxin system toxin component, PIN family [Ignavibacteriae bacterium]|nr:putative toxin-antitoxin system toxin component, PIN family [Ignavibacteriota bacterium]
MKNVVVDTNVIVSGLIGKGKPRQILDMILLRRLNACYSSEMYDEYEGVLRRRKFTKYTGFELEAADFLLVLRESGAIVLPQASCRVCSDPDDDAFLDAAIAGGAQYLITGNKKHFPLHSFRGIRIVSPSEFLSLIK